ncbi:MAG TPA: tRNA (adenosine(37)-N6)-threonylcarbamoyltransferase complex dimerization subunit type 1 TsaB [Chitinophagales bacterium]|nr:tRNA (adenosine(37)-N6)-threonylcarbamoyltransferase complex dimerization subunit type 1 TsaB [Chitinophagales bacterium]
MGLILNIETSSEVCSVCLAKDGVLIDYRQDTTGNSHAKVLTVFIHELFAAGGLSMNMLDAVAVSAGPGSYTGLRIGTSVAKGLCYALNKPLIAVPTLKSLGAGIRKAANKATACYLPLLDARRMDAYAVVLNANLEDVTTLDCVTLNEEFEKSLKALGEIYIGGNAMEKCKKIFTSHQFSYIPHVTCNSRDMVELSHERFLNAAFENTAYFEPFYLKEFSSKTKL